MTGNNFYIKILLLLIIRNTYNFILRGGEGGIGRYRIVYVL